MAGWASEDRRDAGSGFVPGLNRRHGSLADDGILRAMASADLPANQAEQTPFIGREDLLAELGLVTTRLKKRNVLLVGYPGVGKTALVRQFAEIALRDDIHVKEVLLGRLLGNTSFRGDLEVRMDTLLTGIEAAGERTVLFIDEVHQLVSSGSVDGGLGLADLLMPGLAGETLSVIGATTPAEFERFFKSSAPLRRRFHVMQVREPDREVTRAILSGMVPRFESFHGVAIPEDVLGECLPFRRKRFRRVGRSPDWPLTVLDTACAHAVLTRGDGRNDRDRGERISVTAEDVRHARRMLVA